VWEALREQLGPDDVLIANLRITDHDKDHEIDLAVVIPAGIAVLEVKGSGIEHDGRRWVIPRRGRMESVDRSVRRVRQVRAPQASATGSAPTGS